MKNRIKALAVHSRLLAKGIAVVKFMRVRNKPGYGEFQRVLTVFIAEEKRKDRKYMRKIIIDIVFCMLYYQISKDEYFRYRFESMSDRERQTYIGNEERLRLCSQIGSQETKNSLDNKYLCYQMFKEYFGREVIRVSEPGDQETFAKFFSRHQKFIVKPIASGCGRGIYCVEKRDVNSEQFFQDLLAGGACVVEEPIVQAEVLAQFHPQSVNSVRIATFFNAGNVSVLFAGFRAGRGGAIVDNGGAGGILVSVDVRSGRSQSDGYTENGEVFLSHPDTGQMFKGFQIPYWPDVLDLASEVAQKFPQHNYISWDFALTDGGWIMVEANSAGEFVLPQITNGGVREVFMREFNKYKQLGNSQRGVLN